MESWSDEAGETWASRDKLGGMRCLKVVLVSGVSLLGCNSDPAAEETSSGTDTSAETGSGDGDGDPGDGDGDPGDGDGDGDPSDGDPGDGDGDCPVGQLGCMCTNGGGCDPGAICVDGICAPDGSADEGTDETVGDETIGAEPALGPREEAGCACSSRSDPRGPLFGLLALIGLGHAHRRRR
jgi:MYXO-CTERM domain-containing protein